MKIKIIFLVSLLSITIGQFAVADCGNCATSSSSCYGTSSNDNCELLNDCTCTDPQCKNPDSNMDKRTCCAIYGNIGANKSP